MGLRTILARFQQAVAQRSRHKRAALFFTSLAPSAATCVLDLGGGRGTHIATHYPQLRNVWIADRDREALDFAERRFGYRTVLLDGNEALPIADGAFDIVFCSSVIEHVTGPKDQAVSLFKSDSRRFSALAFDYQKRFAREIRRAGRSYFVQTPYRYFPVEVHSWLPLAGILPTHWQWLAIRTVGRFWRPMRTQPDWALLTERQMRELFPDAEIHREKVLCFTKSLIAIRHGEGETSQSISARPSSLSS
jgi:PAS domain-containing protein